MGRQTREKTILLWVERIERSRTGVVKYFSRYNVPFGIAQYYRYKEQLRTGGIEALRDRRAEGNHRRVTAEAEEFLKAYVTDHPQVSLSELQALLKKRLRVHITSSGLSRCLQRLGCVPRGSLRKK